MEPLWNDFQYQDHQESGIAWMMEREDDEIPGGILCDEMGLGKTIQVLGLMKNKPMRATLLVAPLATLSQWEEKAIAAGFRVKRPARAFDLWESVNLHQSDAVCLYIANYEKLVYRPSLLLKEAWDRVVFDEAHRLRNKNRGYEMAATIECGIRWFLTATPIVNEVADVSRLFEIMGHVKVPKTLHELRPLIEMKVIARKMEDIRETVADLPPAAIIKEYKLDFTTEEEAEFYRGIQGSIMSKWRALEADGNLSAQHKFQLITRLRQISIHPQVYISARKRFYKGYTRPNWETPSTKFIELANLMKQESTESHRWMVFCHFHEEMELLKAHLTTLPFVRRVQIYSGEVAESARTKIIEDSKDPLKSNEHEVLLIQLQAGGVGLNLQHFDRVCFMGPWWTAALMDQAIGRAVRIGQKNQVIVHRIFLKEEETKGITNIDDFMMEKAEMKRDLCESFLELAA
jgi:SNF2 family DNA or RNA helicase